MNYIKTFIECNRQTGTSTSLISLIKENGGYLIVATNDIRIRRVKENPELSHQIFTLSDLKTYRTKGILSKPIYFDTDAIYSLSGSIEDLEKADIKISKLEAFINQIKSLFVERF